MIEQNIIDRLKLYDSNFDIDKVKKAIDFAIYYHGSQIRASGEPYYNHPLQVAEIILDMRLDSKAVITALLHDTIEDTELTLDEIEQNFGADVAKLVDGVTKLSKIEFIANNIWQAENFRKLLLAMSDDIRVLLVKLADRLHNMRTIDFIKSPDKRMRIALETEEIYAPLAERIGIQQIKSELQDICFRVLQPEIHNSLANRLHTISKGEDHSIDEIIKEIRSILIAEDIVGEVFGRKKTLYSVWMKMQQKNTGLDQLYDIIAFRIIVDTIPQCYQILGLVHMKYKMVPENFQDFISTPKNNGYQSIHTVVIGPLQQKIEIQIRTKEMHEIAELGVAAHWRYKQKYPEAADGKQYRWMRELLAILEQAGDPEEFFQNTKLAMYYDQVFCFTPKGNLIALPKGATPIDFAYAVHSDVGHHCVGAKVNGRVIPLKSVLQNGDQVKIIISENQNPSATWEKFVITGKARSEIRRFIRSRRKEEYIKLGRAVIEKALENLDVEDIDLALRHAATFFKKQSINELLYSISEGTVTREEIVQQIDVKKNKTESSFSLLKFMKDKTLDSNDHRASKNNNAVPIKGLIPGMAIHFASCCYPLPGDKIVGIIHAGSGVTIHLSYCEMLANYSAHPSKILNLSWDSDKSKVPSVCRLKIIMLNEPGSLAVLTTEIADKQGNIINIKVTNRSEDFFETIVDIEVLDPQVIDKIINSLKIKKKIHYIKRYRE
ncbi:MAG: bifunctional (p)ppGpp synthetase/guanosine-3',5'-bis(diphosphate) 3'-pyrophosphohydrolase [Rickettsiaceae bacterium]|nr:MAG: bifunctional (p)ppGpp synthetase/guanosine-3',5'-bis(diphosphate) 3'-pyrophosphohydrolase [Rickettsiaceae bacterium]